MSELKDCPPLKYYDFKPVEHVKLCPRYTAVLGRSEDDGIGIEELDTLQLELETLLSSASRRLRALEEQRQVVRQGILSLHSGWAVMLWRSISILKSCTGVCIFLRGTREKMHFTDAEFGNYVTNVMFFVFSKTLICLLGTYQRFTFLDPD